MKVGLLIGAVVILSACGQAQPGPTHYTVVSASWGGCEYVSTFDVDGTPVHFQRCYITVTLKNDGEKPVAVAPNVLIRAYDQAGYLLPMDCDRPTGFPPLIDTGQTGNDSCGFINTTTRFPIDTLKPPVVTVTNF